MKLLVSCTPFDNGKSGISVYIKEVVRELKSAGHDLTVIVEPGVDDEVFAGLTKLVLPAWTKSAICGMLYNLLLLPRKIKANSFDRWLILAANRRMPIFSKIPLTAVVHDLSQYHVAAKYDLFRTFYIKFILPYAVRKAARDVVAISNCTAADLQKFWKIKKEKIRVVYNGINRRNLPLGENFGRGNDILYVSRLEYPGKNHVRLIEAFEKLPKDLTEKYRLVLAGADWSGAEIIHERYEKSPCKDSIELAGFVSNDELKRLYRECRVYVFPSLFEGFGLGLIEAMACGAVCAASKTSSLGELAADAALTFEPENADEISKALYVSITDEEKRTELRGKALKRAEEFDWKKTVMELTAPFEGTATVLGVTCSTVSMSEALERIDDVIATQKTSFACFVNADCYNQAFVNKRYFKLLTDEADFVWADGIGIAWAASHLGFPLSGNVNGTDMLPLLCERGKRLFLLGGRPGVAMTAAEKLKEQFPQVVITGTNDGFFKKEDEAEIIKKINDSKPEILLVAMGVPMQEFWISEHKNELKVPLLIGVGGLFDFASGRIPRAPMWMRKCKLEWVFRLIQEPKRLFRRYIIGNPLFIFRVLRFGEKSGFQS